MYLYRSIYFYIYTRIAGDRVNLGVYHLHSRSILHRDLKPENLGFGSKHIISTLSLYTSFEHLLPAG